MAQPTSEYVTHRGLTQWCRVLGEPRDVYNVELRKKEIAEGKKKNPSLREWSFDMTTDAAFKTIMKNKKGRNRLKFDDVFGQYFSFRKDELLNSGQPAKPIKVTDKDGMPWPEDQLIGNGSEIETVFGFRSFKAPDGNTGNVFVPISIKVLNHVPYEKRETASTAKADEEWSAD